MNSRDVVVKTAEGVAELKQRSRKLPPRLRTMLIMIDGSLTVAQLKQAAAGLGAPEGFIDALRAQGLIALRHAVQTPGVDAAVAPAVPEAERFRAAQRFMNDTVVDALGFRAFLFTLKLEKCFTLPELVALLGDYEKAIAKGNGPEAAAVLASRARALLA